MIYNTRVVEIECSMAHNQRRGGGGSMAEAGMPQQTDRCLVHPNRSKQQQDSSHSPRPRGTSAPHRCLDFRSLSQFMIWFVQVK